MLGDFGAVLYNTTTLRPPLSAFHPLSASASAPLGPRHTRSCSVGDSSYTLKTSKSHQPNIRKAKASLSEKLQVPPSSLSMFLFSFFPSVPPSHSLSDLPCPSSFLTDLGPQLPSSSSTTSAHICPLPPLSDLLHVLHFFASLLYASVSFPHFPLTFLQFTHSRNPRGCNPAPANPAPALTIDSLVSLVSFLPASYFTCIYSFAIYPSDEFPPRRGAGA